MLQKSKNKSHFQEIGPITEINKSLKIIARVRKIGKHAMFRPPPLYFFQTIGTRKRSKKASKDEMTFRPLTSFQPKVTCSPPESPEPEKSRVKTVMFDGNNITAASLASVRQPLQKDQDKELLCEQNWNKGTN